MMFSLRKIWDYFTLADYERQNAAGTRDIVARIASDRGLNARLAQGAYMTEQDLDVLRGKANKAMKRLAKKQEGRGFVSTYFSALLRGNNRMIRADYQRSLWMKPGNVDYNLMGMKHGSR